MTEEQKSPVPEYLASQVAEPPPQIDPQNQQTEPDPQNPESQEPQEDKSLQQQMLTALENQTHQTELMQAEFRQFREEQASGKQYIASLEQRGATAPPGTPQESVDFNSMSQAEIVQYMQQVNSVNFNNMANQFGELMQIVTPDADIWKDKPALYDLMTSGLSPKQAVETLRGRAAGNQPQGNQQEQTPKNEAEIEAEVEKRVRETLTQNRSSRAGINGKPARNDATAPELSNREMNRQLHQEWAVEGKPIPTKYDRGQAR